MRYLLGLLKRYRYLVLFLRLMSLAFALMIPGREEAGSGTKPLPGVALELSGPFQRGITKGIRFFTGIWDQYLYLIHLEEENQMLREIVGELNQERIQLLESRSENKRLRSLLGFRQGFPSPLLPAQVIGKDLGGWFRTLIIDRGSLDGIHQGMTVFSVNGIVGQIMESSRHFSRVLLITDRNSSVAAFDQRTRARGIVEGTGLNRCRLKYLHRSEEIKNGDMILSSGLDSLYPKGRLIGTVIKVNKKETKLFQDVLLQPSVDFHKLEEVVVLCEIPAGIDDDKGPDNQ